MYIEQEMNKGLLSECASNIISHGVVVKFKLYNSAHSLRNIRGFTREAILDRSLSGLKLGPEKIGTGSRVLQLGLYVPDSLCFTLVLLVARSRFLQVISKTEVYY